MNETTELAPLEAVDAPPIPRPQKRVTAAVEIDPELRERVKKLRIGGPGEAGSSGMKGSALGRIAWLPWLLCAALALTWGGVAIRSYKNATDPNSSGAAGAPAAGPSGGSGSQNSTDSGGKADPALAGTVQLEVTGYLIANKQITVSPIDVGGQLLKLLPPKKQPDRPFGEGVLYEYGDTIAIINSTVYKAQEDESRSALVAAEKTTIAAKQRLAEQMPESVRKIEFEQLQADIDDTQALLKRAEQEQERQESLRRSGSSVSIKEYQQAVADASSAKARLDKLNATMTILKVGPRKERLASLEAEVAGAEANEQAAKARLAQATWRVLNCEIKAPITGTVVVKKAEVGNLVNPMAFNGGGGICDLADMSDLEVDLKVAERDIAKLTVGQNCRIRANAFANKVYAGKLDRIMPIANQGDSTVSVRVKVKLPEGEAPGTFLKPQMGAVVTFLGEAK